MHIGLYLKMVRNSERQLAEAFVTVANHHQQEPDMEELCRLLACWSRVKAQSAERFIHKYGEELTVSRLAWIATSFKAPVAEDSPCCAISTICGCWGPRQIYVGPCSVKQRRRCVTKILWRPANITNTRRIVSFRGWKHDRNKLHHRA